MKALQAIALTRRFREIGLDIIDTGNHGKIVVENTVRRVNVGCFGNGFDRHIGEITAQPSQRLGIGTRRKIMCVTGAVKRLFIGQIKIGRRRGRYGCQCIADGDGLIDGTGITTSIDKGPGSGDDERIGAEEKITDFR